MNYGHTSAQLYIQIIHARPYTLAKKCKKKYTTLADWRSTTQMVLIVEDT